ncbi:hypothetical protein B0H14DRAFT_2644662 [Mycena olivaceomarginata]|nr:hypothetical protein B0H14DRAFT_2644662 [Mycena olivaceomarginata]
MILKSCLLRVYVICLGFTLCLPMTGTVHRLSTEELIEFCQVTRHHPCLAEAVTESHVCQEEGRSAAEKIAQLRTWSVRTMCLSTGTLFSVVVRRANDDDMSVG